MGVFKLPPDGLSISYHPKGSDTDSNETPQIIRLDVLENVSKNIVRSLRKNERVRLRTGKILTIQTGQKSIVLDSTAEPYQSDLFSRSSEMSGRLYFSGNLSHTLEVQKAQEDTSKADKALTALENTLKSLQEQRASNETSFVRSKEDIKTAGKKDVRPSPLLGQSSNVRKDRLLGGLGNSTPSSPFLSSSYSPRVGPTSIPSSANVGMLNKDKIRLDAIKVPLLHLLAMKPMTINAIAERLRASKDDCEKVLDKVGKDSKVDGEKKELKEKSYRELDVWKFPYKRQQDRQSAINQAIHAFDRMRVEKTDVLWQMLLPKEERGKGKVLSRLNFDKPPPSQSVPKIDQKSGDEVMDSKTNVLDQEAAKVRAKKAEQVIDAEETSPPKKAAKQEPTVKAKIQSRVESSTQAKAGTASQTRNRPAKQENKFKSSERIQDSDEEAEDVPVIAAKPNNPAKRKEPPTEITPRSPKRIISQSPKKQTHKQHLSNSSTSSEGSDHVKEKGVSNKVNKTRPTTDSTTVNTSARSRHNSSPQKPSPLGFSPPTITTDIDNSSSGKASSQSSAPSSPPSSTDMPLAKTRQRYSPVIAQEKRTVSRGRSPTKRKSDNHEDQPPAKRQQTNTTQSSTLTNGTTNKVQPLTPATTLKRKPSESEKSTSPEKQVPVKEDVIDEAKRFQKYYKKYKDLHERMSQKPEKDQDDREMQDLWKMHKRLAEMKNEIWNNWGEIEKSTEIRSG